MTENEALGMLKAKLKCTELDDLACIEKGCDRKCDNCDLNYEQGNHGQQKEAMEIAIKALKEIQQYRAIGTVEECRESVNNLNAKEAYMKQISWERNIAVSQLEEIGVSLGEKMDSVKEAMERQRAKKPIKDEYNHDCCPNCGWIVYQDDYGGRYLPHCENCGQAIDWSDAD